MNLKHFSNQNLLENAKRLSSEERKITTEILHHLREIENRKLHLEMGFSSIFEYCLRELKYSESQAQRRICAMRLIRDLPEVEAKIKEGSLSLSNAAKIQSFIRQAYKDEKPLNLSEKKELVQKIENKSTRECELELIKLSPEPIITRSKERIISEEYTELKLTIKKDLKDKIDQVKNLLSHQNPEGDLNKLLELMCDMVIKKKDPSQRRASTSQQVELKKEVEAQKINKNVVGTLSKEISDSKNRKICKPVNRYIPGTIKQEVYMRDKGCCTFTDQKTKRRCNSKHLIQYDHIKPMAFNGETTVQNLRLLCFQHHKLVTERVFGTPS
ncbi:MAG: HNH endonuclease signature motif containing protein [Bdellovibrionota bacterium]